MDYISHHGVKGMKWGVRRYQRKDGSRTSAGKKRHKREASESIKSAYRQERERQNEHIATKRVVNIGTSAVNGYLSKHNVTLDGRPIRVSNTARLIVNTMLDYKYAKDTFK